MPDRPGRNGGKLLSGNPGNHGGRPTNAFRLACSEALDRIHAVDIASKIAGNRKKAARDRLDALKWLADRAHGRPAQALTGADGGPIEADITVNFVGARRPIPQP